MKKNQKPIQYVWHKSDGVTEVDTAVQIMAQIVMEADKQFMKHQDHFKRATFIAHHIPKTLTTVFPDYSEEQIDELCNVALAELTRKLSLQEATL